MKIGSFVCHQDSNKSFFIGKYQIPVCSRCLGNYMGAIIGIIICSIYLFFNLFLPIGFALLCLMAIDWLSQSLLKFYHSNFLRLMTGIFGGVGTIFVIFGFIMVFI